MPELPEVESLRRELLQSVVGRTIVSVTLDLPKLFIPSEGLSLDDLVGRRVLDVRRRAKLLLLDLSDDLPREGAGGGDDLVLAVHLRLSGQIVHRDAQGQELGHGGHPVPAWGAPLPHRATHLTMRFDDESVLYLSDIRQFGRLWLLRTPELRPFIDRMGYGPEPLSDEFTALSFGRMLTRRSIPIKSALLDQSVTGGVGNIYADESLWEARVHPLRPASSLKPAEVTRLHAAVRSVLDYAVREGVAFVPMGRAISDRDFPYCHGRAGSPCPRCGTIIVKDRVNARGTHYCPRCQRLPRTRRA